MVRGRVIAIAIGLVLIPGTGSTQAASVTSVPRGGVIEQLHHSQQHVRSARQQLDAVLVRAEQATEAYNGARLQAEQAAARSAAAAGAASARAEQAAALTGTAAGQLRRAVGVTVSAAAEQERAKQVAGAARGRVGALAAGAYKTGGPAGFYSALLDADPTAFVDGQELISRVDRRHQQALKALVEAKAVAAAANTRAAQAQQAAATRARQAAGAAQQSVQAAAAARSAAAFAVGALQDSQRAAASAAAVKRQARLIVAAAEQTLGTASVATAELASKAEQARREATAARQAIRRAWWDCRRRAGGLLAVRCGRGRAGRSIEWARGVAPASASVEVSPASTRSSSSR